MPLDTTTLINPNLGVLCQEAQELILDGWKFTEGYPMQIGWQYHAQLEKEVPAKAGRPKGSTADKLAESYKAAPK